MEIKELNEIEEMVEISNIEYNEYKLFRDRQINKEIVKKHLLKQYKREYFALNRKTTYEHCFCCNIDIKSNSVHNHFKSKKHLLNEDNLTPNIF